MQPMHLAARPHVLLLVVSAFAVGMVPADTTTECHPQQRKQARAAATALSRKKDFTGAASVLAPRVRQCPLEEEADFWLLSDLAIALLRSGQLLECRRLIAPVLYPGPALESLLDAGLEDSP